MYRKKLVKGCHIGALAIAMAVTSLSPIMSNGAAVVHAEETVTMNIQFKDGDEVVAGGDYTVPAGVQNYSVLEQYVPTGYKMTASGDFYAEAGAHLEVNVEKVSTDVTMNIQFKDGDEVVAGGDYTVPSGVQNYSVLEQYVPEGYKMTTSGDFYAEAGAHLEVSIEKISTDVIMNIAFKNGDEIVASGDYFVPAGVQNYSVLEQYVPEGYEMTVRGDFMAEAGAHLDVNIEKITTDVIMNVQFVTEDGTVAGGGDYFLPEGVQNYSILEQYVPEGYKLAVSGDFMVTEGGHEEVRVERISTEVIMNIQFKDGDEVVAGGDYFVPAGVQNYSVLAQYVPAGYKMTVSGDFMAEDGGKLEVNVEKINKGTIINVTYTDPQGNSLGGGDYLVDLDGDGIANYSELALPVGYKLNVTGDFFVTEGQHYDIVLNREGAAIIHVVFKSEGGKKLGGGDFFVENGAHYDITLKLRETILTVTFEDVDGNVIDKVTCEAGVPGSPDDTYVFALGEAFQLPEGYQLAEGVDQITDIEIPYGSVGGHTMIVEKIASEEPSDPATPEEPSKEDPATPENPDVTDDVQSGDDTKADTDKDQTKVNDTKADNKNSDGKDGAPQTGDTTSPVIPVAAGGLSLAAIIGVLARKRMK